MLWETPRMIEHYRLALLRVLAGLFVMAGLEPGTGRVETLPRHVKSAILKVLRQAESAGRRLIFAKARGLALPAYEPRPARSRLSGSGAKGSTRTEGRGGPSRIPLFRLIDPRVFLEELYPDRPSRARRAPPKRGAEPQLLFRVAGFDGQPDCEAWSDPLPELSPDDPLTATHISRRMQALHHALCDMPKQVQRMLREMARRAAAPPGPARVPPLRFGFPPGHRKRPIHEVDAILHECHSLATREPEPPDRG